MPLWIRNPLGILAEGEAGGGLVVDGSRIVELVPKGATPETRDCDIFDAGQHVIIPGLVNTHHHFFKP
ncbi:hypothetical protein [Alkalilimnicola ehrlichii]|uniref:hypothetical protein n=1 Tax=Alkalilimnicola ehrlichii TaxID=351052 RepID=UPI001C6DD73D|nr:hypothetical protein [Alkalilimnicola ehrlichii]